MPRRDVHAHSSLLPRHCRRRHCTHPLYRDLLRDYYRDALKHSGQTLHLLQKAFDMHLRCNETGAMLPAGMSELAANG